MLPKILVFFFLSASTTSMFVSYSVQFVDNYRCFMKYTETQQHSEDEKGCLFLIRKKFPVEHFS